MQHYFTIHTKSNDSFRVRGNYADANSLTVGNANSYTFWIIQSQGDKTYTVDTTIPDGDVVRFDDVTIPNGVTLTVNGVLECNSITVNGNLVTNGIVDVDSNHGIGLSVLLDRGEFSGKYNTSSMVDGTVKYTDRIPSSSSISSLVVGIEPVSDLQNVDVKGVWALIDSVTDQRTGPLGTRLVGLDVTVLAKYNDYNTVSGVENSLKLT